MANPQVTNSGQTPDLGTFSDLKESDASRTARQEGGVFPSSPFVQEVVVDGKVEYRYVEAKVDDPFHVKWDLNPRLRPGAFDPNKVEEFKKSLTQPGYFNQADVVCNRVTGMCDDSPDADFSYQQWKDVVIDSSTETTLSVGELICEADRSYYEDVFSCDYIMSMISPIGNSGGQHTSFSDFVFLLSQENLDPGKSQTDQLNWQKIRYGIGKFLKQVRETIEHRSDIPAIFYVRLDTAILASGFGLKIDDLEKYSTQLIELQKAYEDFPNNTLLEDTLTATIPFQYFLKASGFDAPSIKDPVEMDDVTVTASADPNEVQSPENIEALQEESWNLLDDLAEKLTFYNITQPINSKERADIDDILERLYVISDKLGEENRIAIQFNNLPVDFPIPTLPDLNDIIDDSQTACNQFTSNLYLMFLPKATEDSGLLGYDLDYQRLPFVIEDAYLDAMTAYEFKQGAIAWESAPAHQKMYLDGLDAIFANFENLNFKNIHDHHGRIYDDTSLKHFCSVIGYYGKTHPEVYHDAQIWQKLIKEYPYNESIIYHYYVMNYLDQDRDLELRPQEAWNAMMPIQDNPELEAVQLRRHLRYRHFYGDYRDLMRGLILYLGGARESLEWNTNPDMYGRSPEVSISNLDLDDNYTTSRSSDMANVPVLAKEVAYSYKWHKPELMQRALAELNDEYFLAREGYAIDCEFVDDVSHYACTAVNTDLRSKTNDILGNPVTTYLMHPMTAELLCRNALTNEREPECEAEVLQTWNALGKPSNFTINRSHLSGLFLEFYETPEQMKESGHPLKDVKFVTRTTFQGPKVAENDIKIRAKVIEEADNDYSRARMMFPSVELLRAKQRERVLLDQNFMSYVSGHEEAHAQQLFEMAQSSEAYADLMGIAASPDPFSVLAFLGMMLFRYEPTDDGKLMVKLTPEKDFETGEAGLRIQTEHGRGSAEFFLSAALDIDEAEANKYGIPLEVFKPLKASWLGDNDGNVNRQYRHFDRLDDQQLDSAVKWLMYYLSQKSPDEIREMANRYANEFLENNYVDPEDTYTALGLSFINPFK